MAFISTITRQRLPALQRLPSRSIASRRGFKSAGQSRKNLFLLAAVNLFFLSAVASNNFPIDSPSLPPATIASAEGSTDPPSAAEIPLTKTRDSGGGGVLAFVGSSMRNLLTSVEELLTGGFLIPQTGDPVYGSPLGGKDSLSSEITTLAVQEKNLLITESFQVHGTDGPYCEVQRVKGVRLLVSGRDKLRFYLGGENVATLESMRDSHVYEVLRGNTGESIGRIERAKGGRFEFHSAESPVTEGTASTTTTATYSLEGDFINRRFVMRNHKGHVVAKIKKQLIAFPAFDHYVVRIAPGMDPILVLGCTCVVDEELDEELKDKIQKRAKRDIRATGSIAASVGKKMVAFLNPFD